MTRHLLKLVWNRKRTNALLVLEILASFLVLFAVTALAVYASSNARRPLGFSYERVWDVDVDMKLRGQPFTEEKAKLLELVHRAAAETDGVEAVAGAQVAPYSLGSSYGRQRLAGSDGAAAREASFQRDEVTDGFADVMGMRLVAGRFFSKEDDAAPFRPVVVNARFARFVFGDADPIGKVLFTADAESQTPESRVVGVVEDFRKAGELSGPENFLFDREPVDGRVRGEGRPDRRPPPHILVRVRAGTPPAFEERLAKTLQAAAPDWSFEIEPLVDARASALRLRLAPLLAIGLVAGFLLAMVALGLTGVVWQSVTQSTREIGLRRAKGATKSAILGQILGELLVVTSFALALGLVLVLQLPLLHPFPSVSGGVYAASIALSVLVMLLLTSLAGLYPAWLATRVAPSRALRDE